MSNHIGLPAWRALVDAQRLGDAPPELFVGLVGPREYGYVLLSKCGGHLVLRRVNVARDPAHFGAEPDERLDEHGRLSGHVRAAGYLGAQQRLVALGASSQRH